MKKTLTAHLFLVMIYLMMAPHLSAQTKVTTGNRILYQLNSSAQLAKEGWQFLFQGDSCQFVKQKRYRERGGSLTSSYRIIIPLEEVKIEAEMKSYDSFFQCLDDKPCIVRAWLNADGNLTDKTGADTASLYIKNHDLAEEVFDLFSHLRTLCDRSEYPGPSGIRWGDTIEDVTPVLSERFHFHTEKPSRNQALFHQVYKDRFAGYQTEMIRVRYVDGKFFEMLVIPEVAPDQSVAGTWYNVVNTIIDKYGKPNTLVLPQSIKHLEEITNERYFKDFRVFDQEIKEGHWHPLAVWEYKNSAMIKVETRAAETRFEVHWLFLHQKLNEQARLRIAEHPVDDF